MSESAKKRANTPEGKQRLADIHKKYLENKKAGIT